MSRRSLLFSLISHFVTDEDFKVCATKYDEQTLAVCLCMLQATPWLGMFIINPSPSADL